LSATVPEELNDVLEFEEVYSYDIRTAINAGVCVDYELYLPYIEPKEEETKLTDSGVLLKAHFLATGLLRTGKRRCIVYLNTIADCEVFAKVIKQLFEEYHGISIETFTMNCETSRVDRKEILNQFSEPNYDKIKIIMNVRILNEAIDIVACDSVYVTKIGEHTNDITIVQRLGRALRKDPNNLFKTAAMFIWCEEWKQCVNGLQLLKQEDIEFHKKIYVATSAYDDTEICRTIVERQNEEVIKFVRVQCLTAQELWEVRRLEWIRQFVKLGRFPNKRSEDDNEKRSGVWQSQTRTNYKKGTLSDLRIELLNNTEGWKWEQEDPFEDNLNRWKEQCVILGKTPSDKTENIEEKRSGQWQSDMRKNYKNKKLSEIKITILNNTYGWKWVHSENRTITIPKYFQENLDDWKKQYVILGRTPKIDEHRSGQWQSTTRKHYKNGTLSEERIELLNNTEGWKWVNSENRAEIIIRTFEESLDDWKEHFVRLGKYLNKRSVDDNEKRAGIWQSLTRTNYKKGTLSDLRIELLNNTEGWKWEEEDPFQENLDNWKEHFVRLGRNPKQNSEDDNEKRASSWQSHMRENYKKGTLSEIRIELLNNTEGWKWVYSENRAEFIIRTFEENLDDWKEHFVRLGRNPKQNSVDDNEKRAGKWQSQTRTNYKKGTLSDLRIELLNNTEGWKWGG
jgi:hypothetical protein